MTHVHQRLCGSSIIIYISLVCDVVLRCSWKNYTFYRLSDCGFLEGFEFIRVFMARKDAEVLKNGRTAPSVLYTEGSI